MNTLSFTHLHTIIHKTHTHTFQTHAHTGGAAAAAAADPSSNSKSALNESISFLPPAIGSYYFSYAALSRTAQYCTADGGSSSGSGSRIALALYRLVPQSGLPSKALPPQYTVNLPPNATQAQRMQVCVGSLVCVLLFAVCLCAQCSSQAAIQASYFKRNSKHT